MLQQSKFKANDVITLKLITNEEIIGYYVDATDTEIKLRKPVTIVPAQQGQMGFAPIMFSVDYMETGETLSFNKSVVTISAITSDQFKNAYTQSTSGLDLSQTKSGSGLIV